MPGYAQAAIRIARPARDLAAADERFWTEGLGLDVLLGRESGPPDGSVASTRW